MKQLNLAKANSSFIYQMEPWTDHEEQKALLKYLKSGGWLTEFKKTQEFEEMIAKFVGTKYACVMSNGTITLFVALKALGIDKGDEVIVPNFTMVASANAVIMAGAKPVLVDIRRDNLCLDLELSEKAITKKTKALMYVSINGRSEDMNKVVSFCKKYKLCLIEDAAQSLGSKWNQKHLGSWGDVGSFSFSTPKVITTGQGGALVTNDDHLIKKIRQIKDFGREKSGIDKHIVLGYNFKFTDLQAVIGIEQMKKLSFRVERKKEIYKLYKKLLSTVKEIEFIQTDLKNTSPWFIDVMVQKQNELINYLSKNNIGSRPFYPSINTQAPYHKWRKRQHHHFPVSDDISSKGLWLPSSSFLDDKTITKICNCLRSFYLG